MAVARRAGETARSICRLCGRNAARAAIRTKEGDKKERDSGADQGPDDAVAALRQDQSALVLCDNENREQ